MRTIPYMEKTAPPLLGRDAAKNSSPSQCQCVHDLVGYAFRLDRLPGARHSITPPAADGITHKRFRDGKC